MHIWSNIKKLKRLMSNPFPPHKGKVRFFHLNAKTKMELLEPVATLHFQDSRLSLKNLKILF